MQNKALYAAVSIMSAFLLFAALGPGLISDGGIFNSWHYQIFDVLCHQDPQRSYGISGTQMAVCSRCLGIYGLFFAGWLLMPLNTVLINSLDKAEFIFLIAAIVLNLIDVAGYFLGLWNNTLLSRFILGGLFGIALSWLLTTEFFPKTIRSHHGK